jgi:polysaccharide export outer membrane protein
VDRFNGGRKRLIYVRYANGLVKKTRNYILFKAYPKVEKGCTIHVQAKPKRVRRNSGQGFDWNKNFQVVIAQVTAALTLVVLIRSLFR